MVHILADSGAKLSCISDYQFRRLQPLLHLQSFPARHALVGANGAPLAAAQYTVLPLTANGQSFSWPFHIVPHLESGFLAGVDLLSRLGATIQLSPPRVDFPAPAPAPVAMMATTATHLAPLECTLMSVAFKHQHSFQPAPNMEAETLSLVNDLAPNVVPAAVASDQDGLACVLLTNPTVVPMSVAAGDVVGLAQPLTQLTPVAPVVPGDGVLRPRSPVRLSPQKRDQLLQLLQISSPPEFVDKYAALFVDFADVFSLSDTDLGRTSTYKHDIDLSSSNPVHVKQFRIPLAHEKFIQTRVKELQALNVISPSTSPYNTPIFAVPKKTLPHEPPKFRLIQDLRALNAVTKVDKHSICDVRTCLDRIGARKASVFSSLDLRSGYYQMELTDRSKPMTAFTVPPLGKFQWNVTTMGLTGAPASFCKLMEEVMRGLPQVLLYLDDLLIASASHEEHIQHLRECLLRLRQHGLKLNPEKSSFAANSVQYLGHTVSAAGITVGEHKFHAIKNFPEPSTRRRVQQFLGLANFFRHLIPHFQLRAGHLSELLKSDSPWKSGPLPPRAKHAFIALRQALTSNPVVAFPDPNKKFTLHCDAAAGDEANPGGLGAVLTQHTEKGPVAVAFASRALTAAEKKQSAFLLELQAVVWAMDHFSPYLKGQQFQVLTDHKPVVLLSKAHQKTLNRLHLKMHEFPCVVRYRPGPHNGAADALSRNPPASQPVSATSTLPLAPSLTVASIRDAQKTDPLCLAAAAFLHNPRNTRVPTGFAAYAHKLFYHDSVLFIKTPQGPRIVAPSSLRSRILQAAHCHPLGGHRGVHKSLSAVLAMYWWPGVANSVTTFVKHCPTCQETKDPPGFRSHKSSMHPLPIGKHPNSRVHADLFGPLKASSDGHKHVLVLTCAFSKFVRLVPLPDKSSTTVAQAILDHWVAVFGPMHTLVTDQGREFNNDLLKSLMAGLNVSYTTTSAIAPAVNGQAEIFNKWMASYLKAYISNTDPDWQQFLTPLALAYNSLVHSSTDRAPFEILFGRAPWLPALQDPQAHAFANAHAADYMAKLKTIWAETAQRLGTRQEEMMKQQKKSVAFTPSPGEIVLVHFPRSALPPGRVNPKLQPQWRQAVVLHQAAPATFVVRLISASSRGHPPSLVKMDRIKPLLPRTILPARLWFTNKEAMAVALLHALAAAARATCPPPAVAAQPKQATPKKASRQKPKHRRPAVSHLRLPLIPPELLQHQWQPLWARRNEQTPPRPRPLPPSPPGRPPKRFLSTPGTPPMPKRLNLAAQWGDDTQAAGDRRPVTFGQSSPGCNIPQRLDTIDPPRRPSTRAHPAPAPTTPPQSHPAARRVWFSLQNRPDPLRQVPYREEPSFFQRWFGARAPAPASESDSD